MAGKPLLGRSSVPFTVPATRCPKCDGWYRDGDLLEGTEPFAARCPLWHHEFDINEAAHDWVPADELVDA